MAETETKYSVDQLYHDLAGAYPLLTQDGINPVEAFASCVGDREDLSTELDGMIEKANADREVSLTREAVMADPSQLIELEYVPQADVAFASLNEQCFQ